MLTPVAFNILGNAATVTGLTVASGKSLTVNNILTLTGTDGSALNIGAGGALGSAAFTASGAYDAAGAAAAALATALAAMSGLAPLASPTFTGTVGAAALTVTGLMTAASLGVGTQTPATFGALAVRTAVMIGGVNVSASFSDGANSTLDVRHSSGLADINVGFGASITFSTTSERARIDANGNFVVGVAALATNATDGFLYVPSCPGPPTGVPTAYTGLAPLVIDSTNVKLYARIGGAWKAVTLA